MDPINLTLGNLSYRNEEVDAGVVSAAWLAE